MTRKFSHRFLVRAPLEKVVAFYMQPVNMATLTPPPVVVRTRAAPARIRNREQMAFTLWFGPFPLNWTAEFDQVGSQGFLDRQQKGPFHSWEHRHSFVPANANETWVGDEIVAELSKHPLSIWAGLGMWITLPLLFAYRKWKTKKLLEKKGSKT